MAAPHYVEQPCSQHNLVTIIFVMRVYDINIRLAFFQAFTDTAGSANSVGTDSKEVETATRLRQSSLNSPEHQIIIIIVITIIRQSSLNLTNITIIIITNVIIIIKSSFKPRRRCRGWRLVISYLVGPRLASSPNLPLFFVVYIIIIIIVIMIIIIMIITTTMIIGR